MYIRQHDVDNEIENKSKYKKEKKEEEKKSSKHEFIYDTQISYIYCF